MRFNVLPARHLDYELLESWRELREANSDLQSPCFAPEFSQAVAAVRKDVEIACIEDAGRIVAFFPYQRGQFGRAIPVGGIVSDYQGMIMHPNFECDLQDLLKACGLGAWDFDRLITSQKIFEAYHKLCEPSALIDLSQGFETYAAERRAAGSLHVAKIKKLAAKMERELGPIKFVAHSRNPQLLMKVLSWKSRQYRRSGWHDLFSETWACGLLETIQATQSENFGGMLSLLYAGDKLLAGHMGMRSRNIWHYWFPAYDREFSKYSPGLVLLLNMAEHASELGLQKIDLGTGISPYKRQFMNSSIPVAEGSVERPSLIWVKRKATRRIKDLLKGTHPSKSKTRSHPLTQTFAELHASR